MNGILVVNKPKGITSFDVIRKVSKILGIKKIGHTGTLDPLASGVLILVIGKACKLSNEILSHEKEYIATVKIGVFTDTLDTDGKVLKTSNDKVPNDIEEVLRSFKKTYMQEVPIYSAVKVGGKKLYEYARSGEEVVLPKKEVTIKKIELLEKSEDAFRFKCRVSKGTYIRSLIRDIGFSCNTLMTMSGLVRSMEYNYTLEDSYTLEDIEKGKFKIIPIEDFLDIPKVEVDDGTYKKIKNGVKLLNTYNVRDKVLFTYKDKAVAIYINDNNILKSYKNNLE